MFHDCMISLYHKSRFGFVIALILRPIIEYDFGPTLCQDFFCILFITLPPCLPLHVILTMKFCKIWELQGVNALSPKILADQLTLSQPEGADYAPSPLRFSDIAPSLIILPKIIIIPNILKYKGLLIQRTSILITAPKAKYVGGCLNQISETEMNVH